MPILGTVKPGVTADEAAEIGLASLAVDPDYIYLAHHYGTDDWHGAGTPYRTLAAAIKNESDGYDDWVDAFDLSEYVTNRGKEWWPTTCDGRPYSPDGDDHPYIERNKIR